MPIWPNYSQNYILLMKIYKFIYQLFNWTSAYLEFCVANSNCKNWFTIFFLKITICMYRISFIYIPCSVIVNSLINIEHTFRSIIFDFYQRPIYMVEYMVNPVEQAIERINSRVNIIWDPNGANAGGGGAGGPPVKYDYYKKNYVPSALNGPASVQPLSPNSQLLNRDFGIRIRSLMEHVSNISERVKPIYGTKEHIWANGRGWRPGDTFMSSLRDEVGHTLLSKDDVFDRKKALQKLVLESNQSVRMTYFIKDQWEEEQDVKAAFATIEAQLINEPRRSQIRGDIRATHHDRIQRLLDEYKKYTDLSNIIHIVKRRQIDFHHHCETKPILTTIDIEVSLKYDIEYRDFVNGLNNSILYTRQRKGEDQAYYTQRASIRATRRDFLNEIRLPHSLNATPPLSPSIYRIDRTASRGYIFIAVVSFGTAAASEVVVTIWNLIKHILGS